MVSICLLLTGCGTKETKRIPETTKDIMEKDLDNNGTTDNIQIISTEEEDYVRISLNGKDIFECHFETGLFSVLAFEYLDLDQDEEEEIFIIVDPIVNSAPLTEVIVLKNYEGEWKQLAIPKSEGGSNAFPVRVTRGENEFDFVISCEGSDKTIEFDASLFYPKQIYEPEGKTLQEIYREQNFTKGSDVGYTSAWGIWTAWTDSYKGQNCIVAEQGIDGFMGKFNLLGTVKIYFGFDENGEAEILDMVFEKEKVS